VCRAPGTLALVVLDAQYHQHYLVRIWHPLASPMHATVATSSITYNPRTPKTLPTYKSLSLGSLATPGTSGTSTIYNPPIPKSLPPYKSPSLPPGHVRHQKPHSQRKTLRAFRIFPYCRRLPSKNTACARFRRARKAGSQHIVTPIPIALAAQFIAIKDIIAAAKTVHVTQMGKLQSRIRAIIDGVEAVRPVLLTNRDSFYLPSTFRVPTFVPHSLAPDKSYPYNWLFF